MEEPTVFEVAPNYKALVWTLSPGRGSNTPTENKMIEDDDGVRILHNYDYVIVIM